MKIYIFVRMGFENFYYVFEDVFGFYFDLEFILILWEENGVKILWRKMELKGVYG